MAHTAAELTWMSFILNDLHIPLASTPTLYCDNTSALHMTINPVFHARSKHIELDYHFVRERVALGLLVTQHISIEKQVADLFTKPMPKKTLKASAAEIPITTSMWLFGFSPTKPRNLWIIGAILLVILLTIILKKWAIYLEAQAHKCSMEKAQRNCENYLQISNLCCTGVIRTYALEELKMATTDFRIRIGVGATSFVYLAELGDGRLGAVKRVMEERGGSKKMFLDEVSVLLRISHPNLVGLMGFCLEKGEQLLLLESIQDSTTLAEWTEEARKNDSIEVLVGLLDPKLNGDVNVEQLRVLMEVANSALLEKSEARPDMRDIVDRILGCMELHQLQSELPV
ncbi:hypothetical protein VitviT2T_002894 [Vitis vinifera]|uniref:non-specific serine/threonine protein kinase n=1 Tax=Vitis vinifera TaxID=29760 RepID=A0ABY9BK72_VITVI|nr:hypothetical protein VitviT2T_002894 [Vitis vinifera]